MEPNAGHILPALIWVFILSIIAWRTSVFGKDNQQKKWFFSLFIVKVFVGVFVWVIYTYYYTDKQTSDIYRFFADSNVVYQTLFDKPLHYLQLISGIGGSTEEHWPYFEAMNNWYKSFDDGFVNENRTLIRANALLLPFTFGSYFGNVVIICFLGVWAQSFLYRQLDKRVVGIPLRLFLVINLWPSQLFWTSALMKEPLVMMGIAVSIGAALKIKEQFKVRYILLLIFGIWLTLFSKFYIGIALCFPLLAYTFTKEKLPVWRIALNYGISFMLLLLGTWGLGKLIPRFDIPQIISAKQHAFANVALATKAGSAFYITPLSPSLRHMLEMAPIGLFNSLTRPFPTDAGGLMEWAIVTENIFFVLVILLFISRFNPKAEFASLAISLLMFGLIIMVLGGITVNISGALIRYKMPAIPYLALAALLLSKWIKKRHNPIH